MNEIKLLYAANLISRSTPAVQQHLSFVVLVQNIAYEKKIDIQWAGEDGIWQSLAAGYLGRADENREYWLARISLPLDAERSLPGNIEFSLRYRVAGGEYRDNNDGGNYSLQADSGVRAVQAITVLNAPFDGERKASERLLPVRVAVDRKLAARRVTLQWTTDDWKHTSQTPCQFSRKFWDTEQRSNARNPNQYDCQVWHAALRVDESHRLRYRVLCETPQGVVRDDNFGGDYALRRRPLKVMILNLHCRQEEEQDFKLSQIARAIEELDVDVVCLQEVAENWNDGHGDWDSNTARIINARLATPYHLVTDWAHLGFDRYREGVAILSRHPIERHEGRYVSQSRNPFDIHARKVILAQVRVPTVGLVNVFSAHLSWLVDGFPEQFETLRQWAASERTNRVRATLLCGDFNVKAGSRGYQQVVDSREYDDQYLAVNSPHVFQRIFENPDAAKHRFLERDHRIDFIFMRKGSPLKATAGRMVFTEQDYGKVSDHYGYLMTFEPD